MRCMYANRSFLELESGHCSKAEIIKVFQREYIKSSKSQHFFVNLLIPCLALSTPGYVKANKIAQSSPLMQFLTPFGSS